MPKLRIDIKPNGEAIISVDGVKGPSCTDITKSVEKALGTATKRTNTGEYYEQPTQVENKNTLGRS